MARPITNPTPSCQTISTRDWLTERDDVCTQVRKTWVRKRAIGSLSPDSASTVTLSRWRISRSRKTAKMAAASVEPTMAAKSMATGRATPRICQVRSPVIPAVMMTPRVASTPAGRATGLSLDQSVWRPPSKRMITNAAVAISWAKTASSKVTSPRPSRPKSIPAPMKRTSAGTPMRLASLVETIPRMRITEIKVSVRPHWDPWDHPFVAGRHLTRDRWVRWSEWRE